MSGWTDERVEIAKQLRREGWSCSRIGARLGVSRNAVIGKLHREGFAGTMKPLKRSSKTHASRNSRAKIKPWGSFERKSAKVFQAEPFVPGPELVVPMDERKGILDLQENDCRWPINDPQAVDFHFCNKQKVPGLPYCEHHCRRAFQPPQARRQADRYEHVHPHALSRDAFAELSTAPIDTREKENA